MRKNVRKHSPFQRLMAFALAFVMVMGYVPAAASADTTVVPGTVTTVSDPETLTRPEAIYGNDTENAGKVTVGKSVNDGTTTIEYAAGKTQSFTPAGDNFVVTVSQTAQVMGLSTEMATPVDVVFVLDTTGSMSADVADARGNRSETMVDVVNDTIAHLMNANENNRVGVVAFSAYNAGGVDAGGNAANVLSNLAHYTGDAASDHLTWDTRRGQGPSWDVNAPLIRGRNADGTVGSGRAGYHGATNIQAGLAMGAQMLMRASTTVQIEGQTVTRMPFLILLSDGAPVASSSNNDWTNPSMTLSQGTNGDPLKVGNSFLPLLVASYYKNKISERYYPNNDGELSVYTVGFAVKASEQDMSAMTLNPAKELSNTGNEWHAAISAAWNSYANNQSFSIEVGVPAELNNNNNYSHDGRYYFYNEATRKHISQVNDVADNLTKYTAEQYYGTTNGYVTFVDNIEESIIPANKSISALAYNDGYFDASSADGLKDAFDNIWTEIARKALSSPTHVTVGGDHNFEGYVTFTDPIGEYMEVKDMKGILANGNFYQGVTFHEKLVSGSDAAFNAMLRSVLKTRMSMTDVQATDAFLDDFIAKAAANAVDNSFTWWGSEYHSGEEDTSVALISYAEDDSVEYIENCRADGSIPDGADYVCRSYFFYGEAGGTAANPNHEYMYFVVRVQRSLTAPYQQTVVVSIPASLLSVDEVFITESTDSNGNKVYTADVTDVYPTRVIYEVGLRSDINAQNVASVVSAEYKNATVSGEGSVNYDPTTDTYTFFTNEWDRSQSQDSHHRAMTKATFDAASDNAFYTYQEDTLLLNADGTPYTGAAVAGQTLYYAREVYTWDTARPNSDGTYPAVKGTALIKVEIPGTITSASAIKQVDGKWYIAKGVYTASTLQVTGDDTVKDDPATEAVGDGNFTGTSVIVAHAHRTGDSSNSHYTVLLGNNGKLTLVAEPSKTVDITDASGVTIENAGGELVTVGDTLTYRIKVTNPDEEQATTVTITDSIPAGTAFVSGSAGVIRGENTEALAIAPVEGKLTWENIPLAAGETVYAVFQVTVTEAAISGAMDAEKIENVATVKIGNNPAYNTNPVENPPEGKKVVSTDGDDFKPEELPLEVGDVLVYRVRAHNDAVDSNGVPTRATLTITDRIPEGTTYVAGSASHNGVYDEVTRTITWTVADMEADTSVVVSFRVLVDASAKVDVSAEVQPESGEISLKNKADFTIRIGENDPGIKRETNETDTPAAVGDLTITKAFAAGTTGFADKEFRLTLTEAQGKLDGKYALYRNDVLSDTPVTFTAGTASLTIKAGETIVIKGLPKGASISVSEDVRDMPGWTPSYSATTLIVGDAAQSTVTVTNSYTQTPVEFQLKGTKKVEGANFPDGTFTFHATLTDENGTVITGENARQVTATATVTDGGDAVFTFSPRTFTAEGTYYYLINEVPSSIPGVTTATNQYLVKLVISDVNSQLTATTYVQSRTLGTDGTYPAWAAFTDDMAYGWKDNTETLTFTNSYKPADAKFTVSGVKVLDGRALDGNEFSFQLIDLASGNAIATVNNDSQGNFSFPEITITSAQMGGAETKVFTYYIREVVGSLANMDYDRDYYEVVVTVTDVNGQLTADTVINRYDATVAADGTVTYPDTPSAEDVAVRYENKYVTQDVQIHLSGTKILDSRTGNTLSAEEFTFRVVEATVSEGVWTATDKIVASAGNAADGSIVFSPINYTRAMFGEGETEKTFHYIVKEIIPYGEPSFDVNMKYDTHEYQVTVKVTLNTASGEMTAVVESVDGVAQGNSASYGELDFTNIQNPGKVVYRPVGNKRVTGDNLPENLRFSFRVTSLDGTMVEGTGISAPVNGTAAGVDIAFSALEYDHTDVGNTYFYRIEEATVNMSDGVTYSDAHYVLAVTVGRDGNNALTASPAYYTLADGVTFAQLAEVEADPTKTSADVIALLVPYGGTTVEEGVVIDKITFQNAYDARASLNITGRKTLTGRELDAEGNEFEFRLQLLQKDADGSFSLNPATSIVNGTNLADGTVTFGTLNFTDAQIAGDTFLLSSATDGETGVTTNIFQFNALISEIQPENAKLSGVTYDPAKYIVSIHWVETVTPVEGAGDQIDYGQPFVGAVYAAAENAGVYTVSGEALAVDLHPAEGSTTVNLGDYVAFNNRYQVSTGTSVTITAAKTLEGRGLKNGEFTFELSRVYRDASGQLQKVLVETATNKDGGKITFTRNYPATISLDFFDENDVATFVYHMDEVDTAMGGITYSGEEYWIEVVIFHDEENAALVRQSVKYYHTFDTETMTFPEKATVNGEEVDNLIAAYDASAETTPGTADVIFANTYATNDTAYTPAANKVLYTKVNGQWTAEQTLTPGVFSFQVVETNANGEPIVTDAENGVQKVVSTGNNAADGSVTFAPIGYTQEGTYYYVIRELAGTDPTVSYNPAGAEYYLKVVVVDDGEGVLSVQSALYGTVLENGEISGEMAAFENYYGPGYVTIDLGLKKTVEIRYPGVENQLYKLAGSEFDFDVYEYVDGAQGDYVTSGSNGASDDTGVAPIVFGTITVTRADVWGSDPIVPGTPRTAELQFIVREAPASDAESKGITIDAEPIIVTVAVTDDGYGNLSCAVSHSGGDGENSDTFVNRYSADPATVELAARKELINKKLTENEFTFELTGEGITITGIGHDAQGNLLIPTDALTFTAPGEYTFTLKETIPADANAVTGDPIYSYDSTVYTVKVQVTDSGEGKLVAIPSYYRTNAAGELELIAGVTFTNSYTPGSITTDLDIAIDAEKQITDNAGNSLVGDGMLAGFEFVVTDIHGAQIATGVSDENGNIDFGSFTFTQPGEYHYYITEVMDVKPGYAEDARQWAVHVLVRYNENDENLVIVNENGQEEIIEIGSLYIRQGDVTTHLVTSTAQQTAEPAPQAQTNPVFVNIYDPEPTSLRLTAAKILTGRDLRNGEFTFHLVQKDAEGQYSILAGTAVNDADGVVTFYLDFDENDMMEGGEYVTQKIFRYQVHEHAPEDAVNGVKDGITYAANTAEIEVVVRDEDGQLKAYINGIESSFATAGSFTNTYNADDAEVVLEAKKELTGMKLEASAFEFELVDSQGKVIQTVKNAADGSVTFEKLTFTQEMLDGGLTKDFAYTIREKAGSVEGMTYDSTVYTAAISVTDDQKGTLTAVVVYSTPGGTEIPVFHNTYEPPVVEEDDPDPIVAVITAEKTLTGKPLTANAFTFALVDADNKAVSATNDSTGKIAFSIQYTEAGTYVYTLREKIGTEAGMSYDTNTYKVTVTVTENEGVLSASVAYGTADGKAPVFRNSFTPVPVAITLQGTKVLKGRAMKAGEFSFQVKDSTGALVATGTNDANGNIVFTSIALPASGKYVFTVTEVNAKAWFMTYDSTKFTVTAEVFEKDGVLNASVTYPQGGIKFVNTYKYNSSATPGTGDATPLPLLMTVMGLSAAALIVILLLTVRKKKHGKRADR